jgi:hypothetical protein
MMTTSRRALAVLLLVSMAVLAGGCVNPFRPATPEASTGKGVVANYTTVEKLLQTLREAIQDKSASGRSAYNGALADSVALGTRAFYATPDPAVRNLYTNPTEPWDIGLEKRFYDYLIAVVQTFTYNFQWTTDTTSPSDFTDEAAGLALYHRHYELQAISPDGDPKTIAIGYADLYLQRLNGRWYLYRWEDRIDPTVGVVPADASERSMGWQRLSSASH